MKKLFAAIIPVILIALVFVYSSCNDTPLESTSVSSNIQPADSISVSKTGNVQMDKGELSGIMKISQSDLLKDVKILENNIDPETKSTMQGDASGCAYVNIDPNVDDTILTGTQYTYNFTVGTVVPYSQVWYARILLIYVDGTQFGYFDNWTQTVCNLAYGWAAGGSGSITLGPGNHVVTARVIYHYNLGGNNWFLDFSDNATVKITAINAPSAPSVSSWTIGQPPSKKPRITWTSSSPSVIKYVIQKRTYTTGYPPSGTFYDLATVYAGSPLEFIDNAVTVVTNRYDLVYYNVDYRVRAENTVATTNSAPSEFYKHGCYSYTLGYTCPLE